MERKKVVRRGVQHGSNPSFLCLRETKRKIKVVYIYSVVLHWEREIIAARRKKLLV
jgi:hypothetical protein